MPGIIGDQETDDNAKVLSRQSNSTYVVAVAALLSTLATGITAVVKAANVSSATTVPQALVIDGAFAVVAVGLLTLSMAMSADFATRARLKANATQSRSRGDEPGGSVLAVVDSSGTEKPVVAVYFDAAKRKTWYLVAGRTSARPEWISQDHVRSYSTESRV